MPHRSPAHRPVTPAAKLRSRVRTARRVLVPGPIKPTRVLLGLLLAVAYTALLEVDLFQAGINWDVGEIAERDVYADRTQEFVDEDATSKLRQATRDAVPKDYDARPARGEAEDRIHQFYEYLAAVAADDRLTTPAAQLAALNERLGRTIWVELRPDVVGWVLTQEPAQREKLKATALSLIAKVYSGREIRDDVPDDLNNARRFVEEQVGGPDGPGKKLLVALLTDPDVLKPNLRFNREATELARQKAAEEVEPVRRTITRGQLIVQRGHRVTPENIRDLRALGLVQPKRDYSGLFALGCLVFLVMVILGTYVRLELPDIFYDNGRILLLNLVAIIALVVFRFLIWLKGEVPSLSHPAIFCGASTGMVVAVLIEYRLAMMMTGAMGLFMGILLPGAGLWVAFEAWLAGRVGAMSVRHIRDRNDLARAGLMVAMAGMMIAAIVQLPRSGEVTAIQSRHLAADLCFGFGWGLLAFLFAQGLIPLLERPFGCVTPFRLLELTNTSSNVLQMLKREARGTFDASLTIGDMAADASEAIGADPLLARACGYHHDIGKMKHPSWFIENQFGGENVHERLKPSLSAGAIKSHVSLGIQIARDHHLPQALIDVIAQHHGTTMISFFYYQALERAEEGEQVSEELFRYEGPKPQFKESGIIMLADGIEAAVRAASAHGTLSEKRISEIVETLIRQRLEGGQLDECDLTLRELNIASKAFKDFLRGMYHSRIEYPQQVLKGKGKKAEVGSGNGNGRED